MPQSASNVTGMPYMLAKLVFRDERPSSRHRRKRRATLSESWAISTLLLWVSHRQCIDHAVAELAMKSSVEQRPLYIGFIVERFAVPAAAVAAAMLAAIAAHQPY